MRRFLVLTCCLALAVSASPASAKKHKKPKGLGPVVTETATGPTATTPGTSSAASATCPSGLQAVGGGFSAPFTSTGALVVTESYRDSRRSWRVSAVVVSGTGAATAYAYCRSKTLRVTDVAQTGTLASGPGENKLVEADCAPKAVALSGGFQMTSGPVPAHLPIPEESIGGGPVRGGTPPVGYWDVVAQNSNTARRRSRRTSTARPASRSRRSGRTRAPRRCRCSARSPRPRSAHQRPRRRRRARRGKGGGPRRSSRPGRSTARSPRECSRSIRTAGSSVAAS
jgi:hypothetical protein